MTSWLDEPALDVGGASQDKFDVERDINLKEPLLRNMLSLIAKVRTAKTPPPSFKLMPLFGASEVPDLGNDVAPIRGTNYAFR
jgi:hypothetical protein